jgi:hypothetical protein
VLFVLSFRGEGGEDFNGIRREWVPKSKLPFASALSTKEVTNITPFVCTLTLSFVSIEIELGTKCVVDMSHNQTILEGMRWALIRILFIYKIIYFSLPLFCFSSRKATKVSF